jgi:hypothetical protein
MKIRINGNSIRLRLSRPEVDAFLEYGSISDVIEIPGEPLVYNLEKCGEDHMNVTRLAGSIRVGLPFGKFEEWKAEDCVGFTEQYQIGEDKFIKITVEKDFQCLHRDKTEEDKTILFPNPEEPEA